MQIKDSELALEKVEYEPRQKRILMFFESKLEQRIYVD
jgi:hypothetical protein